MIRILIEESQSRSENTFQLTQEQSHHLVRVLRIRPGEKMELIMAERVISASFVSCQNQTLVLRDIFQEALPPRTGPVITLAQALPKLDKMSEILRKCTEIGIAQFVPVETLRAAPQKTELRKVERWQRVIESAILQSGLRHRPALHPAITFSEFEKYVTENQWDLKVVPWEEAEFTASLKHVLIRYPNAQKILLFIGPEGGIDNAEIERLEALGFETASLGQTILRVENAGFYASAWLQFGLSNPT